MITPTPTEEQLCRILTQAVNDAHSQQLVSNASWTRLIKERLAQYGTSQGFKVCTSGFIEEYDPEWLYDLIWYEENQGGFLLDVPLAVESEWNEHFSHIKGDFEKLLAVRATHRLMICQSRDIHKEERLAYFREAIKTYHHRQIDDRYLIAMLNPNTEQFYFELFVLTEANNTASISLS